MIDENVLPFKLELTDKKLTPHVGLVLAHEFPCRPKIRPHASFRHS